MTPQTTPHTRPPKLTAPVPRWQQVADYLRAEILSERYPAGQPLPSEEILAAEFGVSRPTIRQGTVTLVREGLLSVRRPYGTIVRDPHAAPAHTDHRGLTAGRHAYAEPDGLSWTDIGDPVFLRADATADHAALLGIPAGEPMLTRHLLQQAEVAAVRAAVPAVQRRRRPANPLGRRPPPA